MFLIVRVYASAVKICIQIKSHVLPYIYISNKSLNDMALWTLYAHFHPKNIKQFLCIAHGRKLRICILLSERNGNNRMLSLFPQSQITKQKISSAISMLLICLVELILDIVHNAHAEILYLMKMQINSYSCLPSDSMQFPYHVLLLIH